MTIREFAEYCGTSPASVSRYFNKKENLRPELRERIANAIEETGYTPNPDYKRRMKKTNGIVCLILPEWRHAYFVDISTAIQNAITETGRSMFALQYDRSRYDATLKIIKKVSPDGVIFLDELVNDPLTEALSKVNIPTVMCSTHSFHNRFPSVRIDDLSAAYDGTKYLVQLGHQHIGVISNDPHDLNSEFQKITGYKKCLQDHHIEANDSYLVCAGNTFKDGYRAAKELLSRGIPFTAFFVFSDSMANGAITAIKESGLRVPEDISVLGFDGCSMIDETRPKLTSVSQPFDLLALHTVGLLCRNESTSTIVPHTIRINDSCGPARDSA